MPTLAHLSPCKTAMSAADHNPPHFHLMANDGGQVNAAALKEALSWARQNWAALAVRWKELNP